MPDQVTDSGTPDAFAPAVIDKIVRLLCNIQDRGSIVAACLNKLAIPADQVDAAIDEAKDKLTRAANYHRDHELGRALTRLNECYQRAVTVQDTKTAISAQREINHLLGLYDDDPNGPADGDTANNADDPERSQDPAERRRSL